MTLYLSILPYDSKELDCGIAVLNAGAIGVKGVFREVEGRAVMFNIVDSGGREGEGE